MFCPKCGSNRKTSGQRFCTRCGLNLALPRLQPLAMPQAGITLKELEERRSLITSPLAAGVTVTQRVNAARPTVPENGASMPENFKSAKATARRPETLRKTTLLWLCLIVLPVAVVLGLRPSSLSGYTQNLRVEASTPVQQFVANAARQTVAAEPAPSSTPEQPAALASPVVVWSVIAEQTRLTSYPAHALCASDATVAEIAPGGQLALRYRGGDFFGNGPGADLQITAPAQARVSYLVFVRNDPTATWQRIDVNRSNLLQGVKGHDMGHHGVQQAREILIRNEAATPLQIDAVSASYRDTVAVKASHSHAH
jgi:hypothetical protein